jgi:hypothetical protein
MGVPTTFRGEPLVSVSPSLETCANPYCTTKFNKLGRGALFAEIVDNPRAWGLPPDAKQKVVWLCANCATCFDIEFEPSRRHVILHSRHPRGKCMAA